MNKKRILVFAVVLPIAGALATLLSVAFASRATDKGEPYKPLSVSEQFRKFDQTFTPQRDSQVEAFRKLKDQLTTLPATASGHPNQAPGCDGTFCAQTLSFSNTQAMDKYLRDNRAALDKILDWDGAKFVAVFKPPQATPGVKEHATGEGIAGPRLIVGIAPPPAPVTALQLGGIGQSPCAWSTLQGGHQRVSYQLPASQCAGFAGASLPSTLADTGSGGGANDPLWDAVFTQAFIPVTVGLGNAAPAPVTSGGGDGNTPPHFPGVLACPVPYETTRDPSGSTSVPTKLCANVALQTSNASTKCRIRWISTYGNDDSGFFVERFSAVKNPAATGRVTLLTDPILETISANWSQFMQIQPNTALPEMSSFDVLCTGLQTDDRLMRYRLDYETTF